MGKHAKQPKHPTTPKNLTTPKPASDQKGAKASKTPKKSISKAKRTTPEVKKTMGGKSNLSKSKQPPTTSSPLLTRAVERQPLALGSELDCYLHTDLKRISRRAQLRRAGPKALLLLHTHSTLPVFDAICGGCNMIALHQGKKTITRAIVLQSCESNGITIAC